MTRRQSGRRVAVLFDAENMGADLADAVMAAASTEGTIVAVRAWRHWDDGNRKAWAEAMDKHRITACEQPRGRQATDFALVIDAIDLLHDRAIDVFCIVSNDQDYDVLAQRLKRDDRRTVCLVSRETKRDPAWDRVEVVAPRQGQNASERAPAPISSMVPTKSQITSTGSAGTSPTTDEATRIETYRNAHRETQPRDGPWVRWLDMSKMARTLSGKKSNLAWVRKRDTDFVVAKRAFPGSKREVDCVRLTG